MAETSDIFFLTPPNTTKERTVIMPLDCASIPAPLTPLMQPGATSKLLFPVVERSLSWNTKAGEPVAFDSSKALVRPFVPNPCEAKVSGRVLSVVNSTYKLVTNKELFTAIEDTMLRCVPADKLKCVQLKDSVAYNGRVCYREYVFPNIRCDIGAKSDIGFRIVVSNAYGGGAVRVLAGAIEFYCTNGMVIGQYESSYARHSSGLQVNRFQSHIEAALNRFVSSAKQWKRWVNTPVKFADAMTMLRSLGNSETLTRKLGDVLAAEIDDRGENLWAVYSTMTNYASHNTGVFAVRSAGGQLATQHEAATMFKREADVLSWIKSPAFKELERV